MDTGRALGVGTVPHPSNNPPRCIVPTAGECLIKHRKSTLSPSPTDEIEGVVCGHRDGHGFVVRMDGGPDIQLPLGDMRAVLHQDRVKVRIVRNDRKNRPEGTVLAIMERSRQPIVGQLLLQNGIWVVEPEDKRYGQDIVISQVALGRNGQIVAVELTEPPALFAQPVGRVIEVLGDADTPGMEIEIAVRKYGVPHVFSDACRAQAHTLPHAVGPDDKEHRVDLTDVPFVTIDGEDARDFDDAVYCQRLDTRWRLLVAIADVSHYVQSGCAIDADAYDRSTSVYFPRRVIPMLPEKLSNGLCSLNPQVERLCLVCDMVVTAEGDVSAYQFYQAVIYSHARLTYTQVAAMLASPQGHDGTLVTDGMDAAHCPERMADLGHLHGVYRALQAARLRRGAVDFETVETRVVCDASGRIENIVPVVRNEAHRLIEEAMLAANVCSADLMAQSKHPGLYRVHEGPTPVKMDILRNYLQAVGVGLKISDTPAPVEFQALAESTKDRPDAAQIHAMLLRSMQQALYTPCNNGHFGLAFEAYAHFTSPIRRYPDLLVHRVIKAILAGRKYHLPDLPPPGAASAKLSLYRAKSQAAKSRKPSAAIQAWQAAGLHCSANERRADEASRDVLAWLKCQYLQQHLGQEFAGVVSAVTGFGLFVTLQSLYVDGLVHVTELGGGEYYHFDEARQELRGERTGVRYALGTRVQVQVSRVDLNGRRVDLRLCP